MTTTNHDPLDVVHRLSCAIARADDLDHVYQIVLDEVVDVLGVEKASIMIYDKEAKGLRIAAARGMDPEVMSNAFVRVGEGISGRVFESDEPLLVQDIQSSNVPTPHGERYKTTSLMSAPVTAVPLKMGSEPLGVINVTDKTDGTGFTDSDMRLLTTASNQVAAYVHLTHLAQEVREAQRVMSELEVARSIQQRLLPAKPLELDYLDVAGKVIPAHQVGGDFFDYFLTHTRKPSFVVADVSGHNVPAAMTTASLRSVVRAQRDADYTPSMLVQRVNTTLFDDLSSTEQFVSMIYLQYVQSRQLIRYTNAGHPPGIVWRAGLNEFESCFTDDPLMGIDALSIFHEKNLVVSKDDVIVLYTDGVTDAANGNGEHYGIGRLREIIKKSAGYDATTISDAIVSAVQEFAGSAAIKDDITVLVCKVL
jgi:sigma-B regulation protein RsbU (phosphoserine phosphatase)